MWWGNIQKEVFQRGSFLDNAREISAAKIASLSKEEKLLVLSFLENSIQPRGFELPICIFDNSHLSSLESIVKYLVEEQNLKFTQISRLMNRSDKTIWATYQQALKKMPRRFIPKKSCIFIPLQILKNRNLSVLENLVAFLKETQLLSFNQISSLMNRKYRTILTVYRRSIQKRSKTKWEKGKEAQKTIRKA